MKILIIDNDYENIKVMRKHILKQKSNRVYFINSLASDVHEEIEKNLIELIFLDIRFFGAYSIKIVKEILEQNPSMLFVYYGMISEAAYIDKCMEIGGVASFFRPLKPNDIDNALESSRLMQEAVSEKISKEIDLINRCKADKAMFKNKFLVALVDGHIDSENEIKRSLDYYDVDLDENYRVLSIRIDKFRKVILTLEESEKNILLYRIMDVANEVLGEIKKCVFSHEFNSVVAIISYEEELSELIILLNKLRETIYSRVRVQITIGVGRRYNYLKEVTTSYLEAEAGLRYRYHLGYFSVIPIEHVEPNNFITYRYSKEDEQKLVSAAVIGEYAYCKNLLGQITDSLENIEIPQSLFSKIIMNIIISIARYCEEQFYEQDYEINSFFNFGDIIKINNVRDTYNYLNTFLENFCNHVNTMRANEDLKFLNKAIAFIDKEYKKSVSIGEVARICGTSVEYLNKVFVDNTGKQAIDYLLKVRLDAAKLMMRETRKTDDVIAASIGFSSAKYFKSVFEYNEKMNTIEYRKKYGVFYVDKNFIR